MSSLRIVRVFLTTVVVCLATAGVARAQEPPAPPPAHISFVDGVVIIEHDGETEPAVVNMPVVEGDRLRTENGRAQVMFPDGAAIDIDAQSEIEFVSGMRVRVLSGTIEHRPAQPVDPRSSSTQYLPSDLRSYSPAFDRNGSWQYDAQYGNVWYPTVAADWQPYSYGYWSSYPSYGWTWIGYDPWAWPTHHYGRWGFARERWFWIPGRTWSAAWVSWGAAPGYVSWCPLGFDNRPVFSLTYASSRAHWTIVPRERFGTRGYSVNRYAVPQRRFAADLPFIQQGTAPLPARGGAAYTTPPVYRSRGDQRSPAVGVAVPRSGAPGATTPTTPSGPSGGQPGTRNPSPSGDGQMIRPRDRGDDVRPGPGTRERRSGGESQPYAPRYQPQYSPRYEGPRSQPPQSAPPQSTPPQYAPPRSEAPRSVAPRSEAPRAEPPRAQPRGDGPRSGSPQGGGESRSGGGQDGSARSGPHASNPHGSGAAGTARPRPR